MWWFSKCLALTVWNLLYFAVGFCSVCVFCFFTNGLSCFTILPYDVLPCDALTCLLPFGFALAISLLAFCLCIFCSFVWGQVFAISSLLCDIKRLVSQAQIGDTLRRVGLNPSDKRPFRKYSLGMKQRLGIAAAIVESPDLILLDEPFNALDESGIKEIRDLLRELRQKGKLIVLTCHDRQQMESLADEIIAMREGRIVNVDKNCHEEV